ncbi:hypothetical protein F5141DRAFT_426553 [Pisolithus sp. B1]|nr:hypothetical protein F5141DRAFT_426553 [Pisolithus sp. B1]
MKIRQCSILFQQPSLRLIIRLHIFRRFRLQEILHETRVGRNVLKVWRRIVPSRKSIQHFYQCPLPCTRSRRTLGFLMSSHLTIPSDLYLSPSLAHKTKASWMIKYVRPARLHPEVHFQARHRVRHPDEMGGVGAMQQTATSCPTSHPSKRASV